MTPGPAADGGRPGPDAAADADDTTGDGAAADTTADDRAAEEPAAGTPSDEEPEWVRRRRLDAVFGDGAHGQALGDGYYRDQVPPHHG